MRTLYRVANYTAVLSRRARNFKRDLPIRRFSFPPFPANLDPFAKKRAHKSDRGDERQNRQSYTHGTREPTTTDSALISFGVCDSWRMINHAEDLFPSCCPSPAFGSSCYIPSRCIHNCGMIVGYHRDCRWRYCRRYFGKWVLNCNIRLWDTRGKKKGKRNSSRVLRYFNYNYK